MDSLNAICRRRPSASSALSSSCLGYTHSSDPHSSRLGCCRHIPRHGHDQKQPKEGGKGTGCSSEEVEIGAMKRLELEIKEEPCHIYEPSDVSLFNVVRRI